GANSAGITALGYYGDVAVHSTTVSTAGANSIGIFAIAGGQTNGSGDVTVTTTGNNAHGISAQAGLGSLSTGGNVSVPSGTVSTNGTGALAIRAVAYD